MIFQTRSCAAMKERQIFFLSKQNIFLTFSLKFMIVYDTLCVSVFLHSTNGRHARTFYKKMYRQVFRNSGESLQKNLWKSAEGVRSICNAVNLSGKRMEEREHVYTNQQLYHLV